MTAASPTPSKATAFPNPADWPVMARRRFVVRFQGRGAKPAADADRVRRLPGLTVLDESSRMLLIEGDDETLVPLIESFSGWVVALEQTYPMPDTRRRMD